MQNPVSTKTADGAAGLPLENDADIDRRFGGIARVYGSLALASFRKAHVCVIGVGGVGSWAVEALARSAVGRLTLIDLDHVAESNINRQIHALSDTLGMAKVQALAERVAQINPLCEVTQIEDFLTPDNAGVLIGETPYSYIIDAMDDARAKVALIALARDRRLPLITVGSAGGQTDPTRIAVCDLSRTEQEPLLAKVRKRLRQQHGFPRGVKNKFGIDAVYSTEPLTLPEQAACSVDDGDGSGGASGSADVLAEEPMQGDGTMQPRRGVTRLHCAGFGSSVVVTASFGLVAASHVLRKLAKAS